MAIPYTGLFIAASCNSRFSHSRYTWSYRTVFKYRTTGTELQTLYGAPLYVLIHFFFQPNNGREAHAAGRLDMLSAWAIVKSEVPV